VGEAGTAALQLDDQLRMGIATQDLAQRRDAKPAPAVRIPAVPIDEVTARIELCELSGCELLDCTSPIRRPLQCRIVVDHDDAVARQVDVQLEAIRAERHAVIERRNGVLRAQRGPAAMRVNDGHGRNLSLC